MYEWTLNELISYLECDAYNFKCLAVVEMKPSASVLAMALKLSTVKPAWADHFFSCNVKSIFKYLPETNFIRKTN